MALLADAPHLEILSQNTMTCTKLKYITKGMTMHATYERFQGIGAALLYATPIWVVE